MQKYRRLLEYARPQRRFFVFIFFLTIAASALAALQPLPLALLTDLYELTMLAAFYKTGQHRRNVAFEYFYRQAPFGGLYAIHVGLHAFIEYLSQLRFTEDQLAYLGSLKIFDEQFLDHLRTFRFTGSVEAVREGEILLPHVHGIRITDESRSEVKRYVLLFMPLAAALLGAAVGLRRRGTEGAPRGKQDKGDEPSDKADKKKRAKKERA